jgi:hypothetical protein
MHTHDAADWRHDHPFDTGHTGSERRTLPVMGITARMMVIKIVAGWFYRSKAPMADGLHSGHAFAVGLSAYARRHVLCVLWSRKSPAQRGFRTKLEAARQEPQRTADCQAARRRAMKPISPRPASMSA